jgi:hypothetical protein
MLELANAVADFMGSIVIPIAHDIGYPHQDPPPQTAGGGGGGASTVVILAGVVATLAAVAGLVWLKQRTSANADGSSTGDT